MYSRILISGMDLPTYGLLILTGGVLANVFAAVVAVRRRLSYETFLFLEILAGIGAVFGAKLWYALEHTAISELSLDRILQGGWSFYGGFLFGILTIVIVCKANRIDRTLYASNYIFLVPFMHMMWKLGCYMAGCCYGIEYEGIFAVRFPEESKALSGVSLFPVQLLEAGLLGILFIVFYIKGKKQELINPISSYVFSYGCVRLVVEFFRYHEDKSTISMAHIVSVVCILGAGGYLYYARNSRKHRGKEL